MSAVLGPDNQETANLESAERARRLFRYLGGDEWSDYRSIMAVFAGTFFAEFTPDDVVARLRASGTTIDPAIVASRLDSLKEWGNLTVSSSVGNPTDLADYYKRRNRYLITRVGQEVHGLVEGVLGRVDELRDVSTGRLRALLDALVAIDTADLDTVGPERLADLVRGVFDPHAAFTGEITQFFAAINQWQSRYDLSPDEFRFFAEVLVGYVAERLDEIERLSRPIGQRLQSVRERAAAIVQRLGGGLAGRVERAGLGEAILVSQLAGSSVDDWDHLAQWFVSRPGAPSRIDRLGRDAISAIRTLTLNLTRLSRAGIGASSRRADFLRLAGILHKAHPDQVASLSAAAFGLYSARHLGVLADDSGDPVPSSTSWWAAPRAPVPISIRERGDTTNRGKATPLVDRGAQQELLRRRRDAERRSAARIDAELLDVGSFDDVTLSVQAMGRLQQLIGRSSHRAEISSAERQIVDGQLCCTVRRRPGTHTVIRCADGVLSLLDTEVTITASAVHAVAGASQ